MNFIIEYWLQILFGLLVSFAGYLYHQIKKDRSNWKVMQRSVVVLLKQSIITLYINVKYKETITVTEKEAIHELYREYKKLECCDVIDDIMMNLEKKKIE